MCIIINNFKYLELKFQFKYKKTSNKNAINSLT